MNNTFTAHIVTAEAAMDLPEIVVTISDSETGEEQPIATYPIIDEQDPIVLLWEHGWRTIDTPPQAAIGYNLATVEPTHYEQIVQYMTLARDRARIEYERQDAAWRAIIRHAMNDNASATALAKAAGISRARIYQIRDGRH